MNLANMAKTRYLMGGHTSSGKLKGLDRKVLFESSNKEILILNLTFSDPDKLANKKSFFENYFRDLGAREVDFISRETQADSLTNSFGKASILYLPGGDTKTLIKNIKDMDLSSRIASFEGITSGNCAGAYVLCPEYLRVGHGKPEIIPALGIVDFWIKAHYDLKVRPELKQLSRDRKIYALRSGSAVIDRPKQGNIGPRRDFIGEVRMFLDGGGIMIS